MALPVTCTEYTLTECLLMPMIFWVMHVISWTEPKKPQVHLYKNGKSSIIKSSMTIWLISFLLDRKYSVWTLGNAHFSKFRDICNDHTQSLSYWLPFSFPFHFLASVPTACESIEENKNLKLINIPAYHLAGIPAVWWSP